MSSLTLALVRWAAVREASISRDLAANAVPRGCIAHLHLGFWEDEYTVLSLRVELERRMLAGEDR